MTELAKSSPARVVVKRTHFFSANAYPYFLKACAFHFSEEIGRESWGRMKPAGRKFLRNRMREAALEAVRAARIYASCEPRRAIA